MFDAFSTQSKDIISEALGRKQNFACQNTSKCTDRLQPLDLAVNKPAKDFVHRKFNVWYANLVQKKLGADKNYSEIKIDINMEVIREVSATWLVGVYDHLCSNPDVIKN